VSHLELQNTLLDTVVTPDLPPSAGSEGAPSGPNAAASTAGLQKSPFCGDGKCTAGENCTSCAQDCKQVGPVRNAEHLHGRPLRAPFAVSTTVVNRCC
jgi:hypothetical protein